jgi:CheY-like chemotaxis protein
MNKTRDSVIPNAPSAKSPENGIASKAENGGPDRIQKQVRMLHVEDEPAIARIIKRVARGSVEPENMLHVLSAEDALALLDEDSEFDLIFLDSQMRPGMGGVKMIELLAERGKTDILDKIVMFTGTSYDLIENKKAFEAIGGRFLGKACDPDEVRALFQWLADGNEVKNWGKPEEKKVQKQAKVLVVDDDPTLGRATSRNLKLEGFEVSFVLGGKEALELLEKEEFDVIVLDYSMPGMLGDTVLRNMGERHQERTVFCTAEHTEDRESLFLSTGRPVFKKHDYLGLLEEVKKIVSKSE